MMITANTRVAAVLGWPVDHSKSPLIHNAAFAALGIDAVYLALPTPSAALGDIVSSLSAVNSLGASVTVPHKIAVMRFCDELSPAAEEIGAVNTLEFREQKIIGHNTDAEGFARSLVDKGHTLAGRKAVLLGGGGAAKAVCYGLREAGVEISAVIARSPEKVRWIAATPWSEAPVRNAIAQCDLLVDCTSMGLSPESETKIPCELPMELMGDEALVCTLVYHRETALLEQARARGLATVDGAGMLLFQGACAIEIWTGQKAPVEAMRASLSG